MRESLSISASVHFSIDFESRNLDFFTVRYVRLPELLEELANARGQSNFRKVLTQWKKTDLLILDEWMLISLTETEARDLL